MKSEDHLNDQITVVIKNMAGNIRTIREKKGLTQVDMTTHGFGPRWYQRLESGKHVPTLPTLIKLADAFKVNVRDFFI